MDLVTRSPMEYVQYYIQGLSRFVNEPMMFGTKFADLMEAGEAPREEKELKFLVEVGVPRLDIPEHEIRATYKGIQLFGKPDTVKRDLSKLREYKTGMREWTQGKVNAHGQLKFYATIIYLLKGKLPVAHLDWIRTKYDEDGDICVAGDLMTFERKPFNLLDVAETLKRIEKAVALIGDLMKDWAPDGLAVRAPGWEPSSAKVGAIAKKQ